MEKARMDFDFGKKTLVIDEGQELKLDELLMGYEGERFYFSVDPDKEMVSLELKYLEEQGYERASNEAHRIQNYLVEQGYHPNNTQGRSIFVLSGGGSVSKKGHTYSSVSISSETSAIEINIKP